MTIKQSPVIYLLDILSKKWTVQILEILLVEELQFSEIERRFADLSGKTLSRRVKELFDLGLISKAISKIQPLEFKYRITDRGKMLKSVFYEMSVVGSKLFREEILEDPTMDTSEIITYFERIYLDD